MWKNINNVTFLDSKRKCKQPSYSRANRETSDTSILFFFSFLKKSLDSNERLEQLLLSFFWEFRKSFDYFYIFPRNQSRTSIRRPYPNGRETCVVADFPSSEFRKRSRIFRTAEFCSLEKFEFTGMVHQIFENFYRHEDALFRYRCGCNDSTHLIILLCQK